RSALHGDGDGARRRIAALDGGQAERNQVAAIRRNGEAAFTFGLDGRGVDQDVAGRQLVDGYSIGIGFPTRDDQPAAGYGGRLDCKGQDGGHNRRCARSGRGAGIGRRVRFGGRLGQRRRRRDRKGGGRGKGRRRRVSGGRRQCIGGRWRAGKGRREGWRFRRRGRDRRAGCVGVRRQKRSGGDHIYGLWLTGREQEH